MMPHVDAQIMLPFRPVQSSLQTFPYMVKSDEILNFTTDGNCREASRTRVVLAWPEAIKASVGFPFSGIFASAQIAQFAAQNFFLRAIPHFLRRDTQTRLRGFARFCAQILRRKTKFCVPPQILRVFARKFCGAKQNFCGGAANFFLRGAKT